MGRLTKPISILEAGKIPVEELADIAVREGWRPRPEYQAHRWFARRFPSAFRAILVANQVNEDSQFWAAYERGVSYSGQSVLDPFVGGGTSVVEASKLGANTVGVDIDPVACAITEFELKCTPVDLAPALSRLSSTVHKRLAKYYVTIDEAGKEHVVVHFFWVQRVRCQGCAATIDAHPHYQLAFEAEGSRQWVVCKHCYSVANRNISARTCRCSECGEKTTIHNGTTSRGLLCCPECRHEERLIDLSKRTKSVPQWYLFAVETIESGVTRATMRERTFRKATNDDRARYKNTRRALKRRLATSAHAKWTPTRRIPRTNRCDNRLIKYGYRQYCELFNARQLLHLSLLAESISKEDDMVRGALSLAFSDHLTTNCMMAHYAFGWRRVAPLFAIRAFRHITRPVELNPWLDGIGRGTFPNAVRQVQRAAVHSPVALRTTSTKESDPPSVNIINGDSRELNSIYDNSIDLILTDPPYFDNIAYSELADFYTPWLEVLRVIPHQSRPEKRFLMNIAAHSRSLESAQSYERALSSCMCEARRVLKPHGRLIFTYQHRTARAWTSLSNSISEAQFQVLQLFPMLGNSKAGPHVKTGTCTWDAVFVACPSRKRKQTKGLSSQMLTNAEAHWRFWLNRLDACSTAAFGETDKSNFYRACIVAGALGMFGRASAHGKLYHTEDLLTDVPLSR